MKQHKIWIYLSFVVGFLTLSLVAPAQQMPDVTKAQLANRYYQGRDYAKAAVLYDELYESTSSSYYFDLYLTCLTESGDLENAEKEIKKALRKDNRQATLYVQWAVVLKKRGEDDEADKKLQKALEVVPPSRGDYIRLSNTLLTKGEYGYAEQLYLQAPLKIPEESFLFELGRVYLYQRNYTRMFDVYLDMIRQDEKTLDRMESAVQSAFRLDVDNSLRQQLRGRLLKRMQQDPDVIVYNRLLIWLFLQEKNYTQALRQQIALDKRGIDESPMIMELARIAARNDEFEESLKSYDYLISKGEKTPYFYQAKLVRMDLLYQQFRANAEGALTPDELSVQFEQCFGELGYLAETQTLMLDYAHLLAFDLKRPDKAVELLDFTMEVPRLQPFEIDELRTELGDVYVLKGDVYEAILLYSQVIENNRTNELGDQVKMKKARLGYYMGEMSWAKAQLDVLKASTSKLIANDAMELALFIGNNMNLDTTSVPLQLFARADLLLFRNQTDSAWAVLDSLQTAYPFHSLQDDIYYRKAAIMKQQGKWAEAATFLEQIITEYPYDLLADDALLELGDLYRTKLNDPEKAKAYYLKLLEDHPGSVHVAQARIWFRQLRGDFDDKPEANVPANKTFL
ncbi:tetratricopeptide repeat protein [Mangrovibacterium lignilyticum]|uniref:tetratricopeptide repeat protein n=1 Tax=Mangrovibacterium lignilyticum TaxID=2668052 RepID=UPI0013D332F9|nr:tetratricopeptide repeat protein [Mangrovibacterium lignilyticum]